MEPKQNTLGLAMLNAKCPQCRQGDMFQYKWWQVSKFIKFNQTCSKCGLRFDREPGFFHGAMYISYAMIVAMVVNVWLILFFVFNDPAIEVYLSVIIFLNIVLLPFFFRYSRVIYLYAFGGVKFEKQIKKENHQ